MPAPLVVPNFELKTKVRTVDDVQRLRAGLIQDVFGGPLPQERKLVRATMLSAAKPTRSLAIYHGGHDEVAEKAFGVTALRDVGFDVLAVNMPGGDHSRFAEEKYPLRPFLEPVALGLNYATSLKEYDEIIMTGLSGGGWATVLYAAMDTRIARSYPIAGSLPDYLTRVVPNSMWDYEQSLPGLSVGYIELYLMAASEGREQFQVLIRHDPCCFSGDLAHTYRPFVERRAFMLGGQFGLVVDEFSHHDISPTMARLLWGWRSEAVRLY
ncbi:hypothetical protein [Pseudomarimonas salicorniae]|uniref:Esterase n=1 Tax=Pseudomarimonas salicorniae TaxID=2933270 RepID=A0ABT0GI81_9GAMM|nr:hypothetical protein [Lysobacter sp. CAU 1642]MCK7593715.1 hypothetical protein [Lysobacter sp. CAU 1642]